jgi:hypothetical protein
LRQCLDLLAVYGVACDRRNTGVAEYPNADGTVRKVRFGTPGDSDITGVLSDGRRLDLEIKRVGKRPTAAQLDRLRRTNAAGGVGLWVDSSAVLVRLLPRLLAGARIEIEPNGDQWITDEEPRR